MLHVSHILIPRGEECKLEFMADILKGANHLGVIGLYVGDDIKVNLEIMFLRM
jgi:hypothetical protein